MFIFLNTSDIEVESKSERTLCDTYTETSTHLALTIDCQIYSSMRDIFLSKIETQIDDIRKLSHENLIPQLMNSIDYYVDLRLRSSHRALK